MKHLLLVGGGGHCRSCIDVIEATSMYRIQGVVQPSASSDVVMNYPVLGSDESLPSLLSKSRLALVTVGQIKDSFTRTRLFDRLKQLDAELPVIVSPMAYCSKTSRIGEGTIVMHGAIVNAASQIGNNCIINSQALVEHDVVIGDHCHISTGVRLNGGVKIGKGTFIGSGAIVKEGVSIGEHAVVGAGQIISRDVQNGAIVKHVE